MEADVLMFEGSEVLVRLADSLAHIVQQLAHEVALSLHLKNISNIIGKYIYGRGGGRRGRTSTE